MSCHAVLLGDSIFDNSAYVNGGPNVAAQLRELLSGGAVTLTAIDGSTTWLVEEQLAKVPDQATHLVVSAGGNDILHLVALLDQPAETFAESLVILGEARAEFMASHRKMLEAVVACGLPVAVCTIYDANYDPPVGAVVATAMGVFNDAITRNAHTCGCDLIDLRLVCTERADYANPIEPSVQGGEKIARAVARYLDTPPALPSRTRVFI